MTPAEVAASLDEPDWIAQWQILKVADDGFDALLSQWRKWHWTPIAINGKEKKQPASATDGVIALARMGVMPPSGRGPGLFEEQHDAMMWFQSQGRSWRIWGILDGWLIVNSFGDEWRIDLKRMKWDNYVTAAAAALGSPATPATGEPLKGPDTRSP